MDILDVRKVVLMHCLSPCLVLSKLSECILLHFHARSCLDAPCTLIIPYVDDTIHNTP